VTVQKEDGLHWFALSLFENEVAKSIPKHLYCKKGAAPFSYSIDILV